jgi:hypothetical protein
MKILICYARKKILPALYIHVTVHHNRFLLNNQPDALIIQIYSVIKLHVSGNFSAHRQEFSTVHSALVSFMQVSKQSQNVTPVQPDSA